MNIFVIYSYNNPTRPGCQFHASGLLHIQYLSALPMLQGSREHFLPIIAMGFEAIPP
jgi:hypothetical protein